MSSFIFTQVGFSRKIINVLLFAVMIFNCRCKKFLDQKPNQTDVIPTNLTQLQSVLENADGYVNARGTGAYAELVSDNIYVSPAIWNSAASGSNTILLSEAQNYVWGNLAHDNYWVLPYSGPIYFANVVLDQLPLMNITAAEQVQYNVTKGSALFFRAFAFLGLAQLYCKPYAADNAQSPGIVVRLTTNLNIVTPRSTVQQVYDQIIADLKQAADLLPQTVASPTHPTKAAAYAALARTYLYMGDYSNAGSYANLALQQKSTLMDYNTLIPVGSPTIKSLNDEVIFHNSSQAYTLMLASNAKIDSGLYRSYDANDLRQTVFFKANTGANAGTYSFRGSYHGNNNVSGVFDGLAVDEEYLIRAECAARKGDKDAALADLNSLMIKRWNKNVTYPTITATDARDALNKILAERRKELVFRGQRWPDIRRFNLEGAAITLKRTIGNNTYTLPPNDLRSVMLIPLKEINGNPGVTQNPR